MQRPEEWGACVVRWEGEEQQILRQENVCGYRVCVLIGGRGTTAVAYFSAPTHSNNNPTVLLSAVFMFIAGSETFTRQKAKQQKKLNLIQYFARKKKCSILNRVYCITRMQLKISAHTYSGMHTNSYIQAYIHTSHIHTPVCVFIVRSYKSYSNTFFIHFKGTSIAFLCQFY